MDSFDGKHPDPPREPMTKLEFALRSTGILLSAVTSLALWIWIGSMLADYYELVEVTRLVVIMFWPIPIVAFVALAIELWRYQQRD